LVLYFSILMHHHFVKVLHERSELGMGKYVAGGPYMSTFA
jgi:hypothetical protein